jgi:hypothetical protein
MRSSAILLAFLLVSGAAQAQAISPLGGSTGNPPGPPPAAVATPPATSTPTRAAKPDHARRSLADRFDAANTTHDGKLTLSQARAGHMNAVARDFAQIDKEKRGYVTMDDIRAFQKERRDAKRAARPSAR